MPQRTIKVTLHIKTNSLGEVRVRRMLVKAARLLGLTVGSASSKLVHPSPRRPRKQDAAAYDGTFEVVH